MERKITNRMWDSVEYNPKNQYYKICYFNTEKNQLEEVARFRNAFNKNSRANYALLQIWTPCYDEVYFEKQGGCNTCGGYNKPIANLESCLYQFEKNHDDFKIMNCGSILSLMNELLSYLQRHYIEKLFIVDCNG
jgi:hypothetical protein